MGGAWGCGLPCAAADVVVVDTVVDADVVAVVVDDAVVVVDDAVVDIVVVALAVVVSVVPCSPAVPKTSCPSACGGRFSFLSSSPPTNEKAQTSMYTLGYT